MDVNVDLTSYPNLKERGAALAKIGDSYVMVVPKWDESTGQKRTVPVAVGREHIAAMRERIAAQKAALDMIEAEMNALDGGGRV